MPAPSLTGVRVLTKRLGSIREFFLDFIKRISLTRWIILLGGVGMIGYSQFLMEIREPQGIPNPTAESWNALYRLEVVNYDNVFFALPYFIGGAILCGLSVSPPKERTPFTNWSREWYRPGRAGLTGKTSPIVVGSAAFLYLVYQLGRHQYQPVYPVIWIISIISFTLLFLNRDRSDNISLAIDISSLDLLWVTLLLLLGFLINSYGLMDIPVTIIPDEGNFWETARAISLGHIKPVIFDSGVYTFPIASSVFQGWVLRIFGTEFWAWRFSSVIAGTAAVIPLYLLAKEWFGRGTAITACIMMIASPYFISFSRLGYNNSQALFPVTLCIYMFAIGARKGSRFYIWMAGLAAGIGFYTYSAAWMGLISLVLLMPYLLMRRELKWKSAFAILGIILLGWALLSIPRILYTASGNFGEGLVYKVFETSFASTFYGRAYYGEADLTKTMPLINVGAHQTLFYDPSIYGELLLRGTVRTFLSLFDPFIVFEHFLYTGLAGVITPVFLLIGLAMSVRNIKQLRFAMLMVWFFGGVLFLSIIGAFPPRHTHLVSLIPGLALISGAGLTGTVETLVGNIPASRITLRALTHWLLMISTLVSIVYFGLQRYFYTMPIIYLPTFEDVASWIAWNSEDAEFLIYLDTNDSPHRLEYLVKTGVVEKNYQAKLFSGFSPQMDLKHGQATIIFMEDSSADGSLIPAGLPGDYNRPIQYRYPNGDVIGYVAANMDVDTSLTVGPEEGLQSLTQAPVRFVLTLLLIMALIFGWVSQRGMKRWPNKEILIDIGGPSGKDNGYEFRLRIRIPPLRRTRQ